MGDFAEAAEAWRRRAFPEGSEDEDLDELHADLALADTWVAEVVIPFVEGGVYAPLPAIDLRAELQALRDRVEVLRLSVGRQYAERLGEYSAYVTALVDVYDAFAREGGCQG